MSKVYVVTDSTADLTEEEVKTIWNLYRSNEYLIDEYYIDGVITKDEFKQKWLQKLNFQKQLNLLLDVS